MRNRNLVEATLVPHTAFSEGKRTIEQWFSFAKTSAEPICGAIIGESRTGKSRLMEEVSEPWKKTRTHQGLLVPAVRIKTPAKPTVKGLVTHLLRFMEDPLYDKGTESCKTIRLHKLMQSAGTHMVLLDEFQHFYNKRRNIGEDVADWLKIFVEEAKVSLVVAGLPSCKAVIDQNEQLAGRFLQPIILPRFDWAIEDGRNEFISILEAFTESMSQDYSMPDLADEGLAFRVWCATGGLIGYVSKFLRQVAWDAFSRPEGKPSITLEDLNSAHQKSIWQDCLIPGASRPFESSFSLRPNQDVIALVLKIGTVSEPKSVNRVTPQKPKKMTSSIALGGIN